jgi:hypothetical protein
MRGDLHANFPSHPLSLWERVRERAYEIVSIFRPSPRPSPRGRGGKEVLLPFKIH